jgi:hypothetical protein
MQPKVRFSVLICLLLISTFWLSSCNNARDFRKLNLFNLEEEIVHLSKKEQDLGTVLIFMSPDCPIVQRKIINLNALYTTFHLQAVSFYGIVPGSYYSDSLIRAFQIGSSIAYPIYKDPDFTFTASFGATVSPEVFVLNKRDELIYQGLIDDAFAGIGKVRQAPQNPYLELALKALLEDKMPEVSRTEAVGCLLYY